MADLSQEIGTIPGQGGQRAFGDIYTYTSPETDKLSQQLWQTERLNAIQGNKAKMALDKTYQGILKQAETGARGGDIPEIVQGFNDWKNSDMALRQNGNNMSTIDRVNAQNASNQLYANTFQLSKESSEFKPVEAQRIKNIYANTGTALYNDDAASKAVQGIDLPLSQLKNMPVKDSNGKPVLDANGNPQTEDWTSEAPFRYQSTVNLNPYVLAAAGNKPTNKTVDVTQPNQLYTQKNTYPAYLPPNQMLNTLTSQFMADDLKNKIPAGKINKEVRFQISQIPQDELTAQDVAFNQKIQDPTFKSIYGNIQPFPAFADNTPEGKLAKYKTEQFYNNQNLTPQNMQWQATDNVLLQKQAYQKEMQDARFKSQYELFTKEEGAKAAETAGNLQAAIDDQQKYGTPEKDLTGAPTGNTRLLVAQPILDALTKKNQPVYNPDGTKDDAGNDIGHLQVKDANGKPITTDIPATGVVALPNGNKRVEFANGTSDVYSNNGYMAVLQASKAYDTKIKQASLPQRETAPATQTQRTTIKKVKVQGL